MGYKSRGAYPVAVCFKKCANRDKKCNECFRWSEFKRVENKKENK